MKSMLPNSGSKVSLNDTPSRIRAVVRTDTLRNSSLPRDAVCLSSGTSDGPGGFSPYRIPLTSRTKTFSALQSIHVVRKASSIKNHCIDRSGGSLSFHCFPVLMSFLLSSSASSEEIENDHPFCRRASFYCLEQGMSCLLNFPL